MAAAVYIVDPVVALHYHVAPGEWINTPDDEAAWLITQRHGWSINSRAALPAAGYVHRGAPHPFVPFETAVPKAPPPAAAPVAPARQRV